MKTATAGMIAMLQNNNTFYVADLYTFTLQNGSIYYYTDADIQLVYGGNTFVHNQLRLQRTGTKLTVGLEVDTMSINVYPQSTDLINGITFLKALAQGQIDGAIVKVDRAIMTTWGNLSNGVISMFIGRVSESSMSRTSATITVKSELELLNIQMPKNLYNLSCIHALYDAGCTLAKTSFQTTTAINAGSTATVLKFTGSQAVGYFEQGFLVFTSGANNGLKRTVKTHTSGTLTLALALPSVPTIGDTFTIYAGCDRTQATCTNKFNNLLHFRGFPFIPPPEVTT